jgi:hypothetical protein
VPLSDITHSFSSEPNYDSADSGYSFATGEKEQKAINEQYSSQLRREQRRASAQEAKQQRKQEEKLKNRKKETMTHYVELYSSFVSPSAETEHP